MANFSVKVQGLDKVLRSFRRLPETVRREARWEMQVAADDMVKIASKNAPADEGSLRNAIQSKPSGKNFEVVMSKTHGIYMEFGTKSKFDAPSYLGSYPARFKGIGKGSYNDALKAMMGWVKRKGLVGNDETEQKQVAYLVLRKILKEGLKPRPYFFPAFQRVSKELIDRLRNILRQELK
jgi:hypothetical protein